MYRFLAFFALALTLAAGAASPADAGRRGGDGSFFGVGFYTTGQDLLYVSPTNMSGGVSVCHLVERASLFGILPIYTTLEGYALGEAGCNGASYTPLDELSLVAYQNGGAIPRDVPAEASLSILDLAWGHAFLLGAGLLLLLKGVRGIFGRRKQGGALPMKNSEAVAIHSIIAMSNVAAADGSVDPAELHEMSNILSRIKGHAFSADQVAAIVQQTNPTMEEFVQVGQGLSKKDRRVVMQAALTIAVADGRIDPREYDLVTTLAQQMGISGDDFRAALNRVSHFLNAPLPA